jgi:hypothetical protein
MENEGYHGIAYREKTDSPKGLKEEISPPKTAHFTKIYISKSLDEFGIRGNQTLLLNCDLESLVVLEPGF